MARGQIFPTISVMVVDDDAIARKDLHMLLQRLGVKEIVEALDGRDAMRRLESGDGIPDVIITDVVMPDMDGYEFIRHLRFHRSAVLNSIPLLVLTGYETERNVLLAQTYRIQGFIGKPPNIKDLQRMVLDAARPDLAANLRNANS